MEEEKKSSEGEDIAMPSACSEEGEKTSSEADAVAVAVADADADADAVAVADEASKRSSCGTEGPKNSANLGSSLERDATTPSKNASQLTTSALGGQVTKAPSTGTVASIDTDAAAAHAEPPPSGFSLSATVSSVPGAFRVMPVARGSLSSTQSSRPRLRRPQLTEHPPSGISSRSTSVSEVTHDGSPSEHWGRRGSEGDTTIPTISAADIDTEVIEAQLVEEGTVNDDRTGSSGNGSDEGDNTRNDIDASLVIHAVEESKFIRRFRMCGKDRSINILSTAAVFVLLLGLIVAVSVASSRRAYPDQAQEELTRDRALEILWNITDPALLDDPMTSQGKALNWLVEEDEFYVSPSNERKVLQRYVLATLHFAANGEGHHYNGRPFLGPGDECDWSRTLCETADEAEANNNQIQGNSKGKDGGDGNNSFRAIRQVDLSYAGLNGTMPDEVGELEALAFLYYSGNSFHGSIPTSIGRLDKLKQLALMENKFSSSLPTEMGNLENLALLAISRNELSGTVPLELANMRRLYWAFMEENYFTGSLDHMCDLFTSYFISDCLGDNLTCSCCTFCA